MNWTIDSKLPPKTIEPEGPTNLVTIRCPEHRWMTATIYVLENPFFAVTDKAGRFEIKGLVPGKYSIETDHANSEKSVVDFELNSKNEEILIKVQPKRQRTASKPSIQK